MTPTPCAMAGCNVLGLRIPALGYLLTYIVGSGRMKPTVSPKRLKIKRKLLLTAHIKSYTASDCRQNV